MSVGKTVAGAVVVAMLILAFEPGAMAKTKGHLDDTLFSQYFAPLGGQSITFSVCGKTKNMQGCFGSGSMDPPFDYACAVVEGAPVYKKNRVTRPIYVLDKRISKSDQVFLYVYSREDTITDNDDAVVVSFQRRIFLGITAGLKAHCHMAISPTAVYVGTDLSANAVSVNRTDFTLANVGGAKLATITADDRGYVAVNSVTGNLSFAPDGTEVSQSAGADFIFDFVSTSNAWIPPN